jgi:hypothetical protein
VQTADEIVALHVTVGQQRAAVQAAAEQDGNLVAVPHDDQIDAGDQGVCRPSIRELPELRDDYLLLRSDLDDAHGVSSTPLHELRDSSFGFSVFSAARLLSDIARYE